MIPIVLLNLGYVALVAASFTSAMVKLRCLLIAAAFLLAGFGVIEDIPSMVAWNALIGSAHTWSLLRHLWRQRGQQLDANTRSIAAAAFPELTDRELYVLWTAGEKELRHNVRLTTAGAPNNRIALIIAGRVEVRRDEQIVANLLPGSLIGEMSVAREGIASADTYAIGSVWLRVWTVEAYDRLAADNPRAIAAFDRLVQRDLADKLETAGAGDPVAPTLQPR